MATSKKNKKIKKNSKKNKPNKVQKQKRSSQTQNSQLVELEFLAGLKEVVREELKKSDIFKDISNMSDTETSLLFRYSGNLTRLKKLRTVVAVYAVKNFAVPRPKALLGHEHWNSLLEAR